MGQRYSGVHRSREGILQDGKSGEFFPDIFSFESNAGTRRAGLVLEIIVSHSHVPGRGSRPVRLDGCNDLRVLLPAERDHVQGGTTQRCNPSHENLGIVERDELGALFDPACGSDSILCVVAQDLFDRRIVFVSWPEARSPLALKRDQTGQRPLPGSRAESYGFWRSCSIGSESQP